MGSIGTVLGFKTTYPRLNLDLFSNDLVHYELGINSIATNEFNRGFKIKRLGKATKKGTSITFESIKTEKEAMKLREELIKKQRELLDKTLEQK